MQLKGCSSQTKKRIRAYVKQYAKKHNITKEQAEHREIVQNVIWWLKLKDK